MEICKKLMEIFAGYKMTDLCQSNNWDPDSNSIDYEKIYNILASHHPIVVNLKKVGAPSDLVFTNATDIRGLADVC